jgi:signal transduction histidine kinase
MNLVPIQAEAGKLGEPFAKAVDESLGLIDQLSQELRTISHLLHPPMLDEAGLEFALQWFIEGFAQRSKIDVDFELAPEIGRLPSEVETAVFRLVQECLTNIHRHSGSRTAQILLTREGEQLRVSVRDQGRGMVLDGSHARPGVGIQGMRERLRQLGGHLEIQSRKDQGTTIIATLPVAQLVAVAQSSQIPS